MKISKNPNKNWENNTIQFPRLIAELEAIGAFNQTIRTSDGKHFSINEVLCQEMDLTMEQLYEIISRAQAEWDDIKEKTKVNETK